jgi:anti-sigma regulatory factor (Ser/Thr protein kinase)
VARYLDCRVGAVVSTPEHRALIYHDPAQFTAGVGAFARDGLEHGEHVLAVLTAERQDWLREELGAQAAAAVDFADAGGVYERHGPMFETVLGHLQRHAAPGHRRLRIVAEQALALRHPVDVRAYLRYEAASNVAYERFDAAVLCPYDAGRLPAEILDAALQTHPEVLEDGRARRSERFADPRAFVRKGVRAEPLPAGTASLALEGPDDLAIARSFTRAQARAAGLPEETVEDLTVAVGEITVNALIHGEPPRTLWGYVEDGHLVCRVRDAGSGLPEPLAGYLPPDRRRFHGRGLWLAHQLCDSVEIVSDGACTDIFLRTRLGGAR